MDEQRLERELRVGLADLLDPAFGSHPRWAASPAAERVAGMPARRALSGRFGLLWAAALVGLLLVALLAATVFVGARRSDQAVVIAPSPTRSIPPGEATILATTNAKPLPAQATCPPGSNPDAPGLAAQERPVPGREWRAQYGAIAFDRNAGRVVLLADDASDPEGQRSQTWTFDVCTNTWQRMSPAEEPSGGWGWVADTAYLVYDADSDLTLAFTIGSAPRANYMVRTSTDIWSYDLVANRWTKVRSFPWPQGYPTYGTVFYHDPSGLVVIYDGMEMWAYDVDTDTLVKVREQVDRSLPAGSWLPEGKIAFGYDPVRDLVVAVVVPHDADLESDRLPPVIYRVPKSDWGETWTFDPGTGAWHKETALTAADLIVCGTGGYEPGMRACYPTWGRAVFDEGSGLTVFINRDWGPDADAGRVDAWDAGLRTWRTLFPSTGTGGDGPPWCQSAPPVYDPVNERIVCLHGGDGGDIVSAFSTATNTWRWLLEPLSTASPAP